MALTAAQAAQRPAPAAADLYGDLPPDDPWVAWPLEGPFADLHDVCTSDEQTCDEESGLAGGPDAVTGGDGPIREARIFRIDDGCHLGVRTDAGWYVSAWLELCHNSGSERMSMTMRELRLADVVGDPTIDLYLRFEVNAFHSVDGGEDDERVMVCGVGASGVPSCTRPMTTWWRTTGWNADDTAVHRTGGGALRIRFGAHGMVARRVRGTLAVRQRALRGRHAIDLP